MSPDRPVRPLRILHINRSYPHHRAGGMENHAQALLEGLMERGHTVDVITTPLPTDPALKELKPNGRLIRVGNSTACYDLHFFWNLRTTVSRVCRAENIDLIHCQGFSGIPLVLFPFRKMPPVVTSIHGTLTSETSLYTPIYSKLSLSEKFRALWKFKKRLLFIPIWNWFLEKHPNLICDSRFTIKELRKIAPKSRCKLLPLGFDCDKQPSMTESKGYALFVGRLEKIKGADFLLEIWKSDLLENQLPELRLIGKGPEESILREKLKQNDLVDKVKILGRLSDAEVQAQIAGAAVLLNPDRGYPAFGLINAEAICQGTPVVASPNGAHSEVVLESDGKLTKLDVSLWKSSILSLIENDSIKEREIRSSRGQRRFSRELMIRRLEKIYVKLLQK